MSFRPLTRNQSIYYQKIKVISQKILIMFSSPYEELVYIFLYFLYESHSLSKLSFRPLTRNQSIYLINDTVAIWGNMKVFVPLRGISLYIETPFVFHLSSIFLCFRPLTRNQSIYLSIQIVVFAHTDRVFVPLRGISLYI